MQVGRGADGHHVSSLLVRTGVTHDTEHVFQRALLIVSRNFGDDRLSDLKVSFSLCCHPAARSGPLATVFGHLEILKQSSFQDFFKLGWINLIGRINALDCDDTWDGFQDGAFDCASAGIKWDH